MSKGKKPAPATELTDELALNLTLELIEHAQSAGAFASLGPQGWDVIKRCKRHVAGMIQKLNAPTGAKKG